MPGRYPDVEPLLDEVRGATGLADFGPGDFRTGLEVFGGLLDRSVRSTQATWVPTASLVAPRIPVTVVGDGTWSR